MSSRGATYLSGSVLTPTTGLSLLSTLLATSSMVPSPGETRAGEARAAPEAQEGPPPPPRGRTSSADDGVGPPHHLFIILSPLHHAHVDLLLPAVTRESSGSSGRLLARSPGSAHVTSDSPRCAPRCWCGCCVAPAARCSWSPSWPAARGTSGGASVRASPGTGTGGHHGDGARAGPYQLLQVLLRESGIAIALLFKLVARRLCHHGHLLRLEHTVWRQGGAVGRAVPETAAAPKQQLRGSASRAQQGAAGARVSHRACKHTETHRLLVRRATLRPAAVHSGSELQLAGHQHLKLQEPRWVRLANPKPCWMRIKGLPGLLGRPRTWAAVVSPPV